MSNRLKRTSDLGGDLLICGEQGEDWEEGFASGLLNSLCFFPLLSYGSTAPLAELPQSNYEALLAAGWDEKPVGRKRLCGDNTDQDDNVLKELLIAVSLLHRRDAPDRCCAKNISNDEEFERGEIQVSI